MRLKGRGILGLCKSWCVRALGKGFMSAGSELVPRIGERGGPQGRYYREALKRTSMILSMIFMAPSSPWWRWSLVMDGGSLVRKLLTVCSQQAFYSSL